MQDRQFHPAQALSILAGLSLSLNLSWASVATAAELAGFDCLIEPRTVVEVSTREQGILQSLLVSRGDMVEEG